jgi:predicted transcriptional regulator
LLNDWPLLQVGTGYGPENLIVCAPGLTGTADNSPGYSGARLLRVIELRIDDDTFPDLVVLRTAGDARWRLDVFTNRVGQLAEDLERARHALLRAALGQNDNMVRRAVHRVRELERETGAGEVSQERSVIDRFRASVRLRNTYAYAGAFFAAMLGAALGWLLVSRRRRTGPTQQIEKQPIADRVALAADLIALDHNFMSKGNRPAGFERLIEIRNRYGLERDRDLGQSGRLNSQQLVGVYASAITRLIDGAPTLQLLDLLQTTARSAPRAQDFEFLELSPEELRRLDRQPGIRLIAVVNHEYPDYLRRFRIFANPEVRGTLEHIILDHIRHAAKWAHIITSYTVNTQWNRRLRVSFRSDSPHVVPFANPRAHITSQVRELATMLRPAIEVPRDANALVGPLEKLWFSLADYIAVLEETRTRVSVP